MKVRHFRLDKPLKDSNPLGSWNSTWNDPYLYVGSNGFLTGYDAKTFIVFLKLEVKGNVYRARTLFGNQQLVLVVDSSILLFNNSDPKNPSLLQTLNVEQSIIDFVTLENSTEDLAVLYVLTQQGLLTVTSSATTLTLVVPDASLSFAANLNAGLVVEAQTRALYVLSVTHGAILTLDIRNRLYPILTSTIRDKFYPVDGQQTSRFPNLLVTGGIFGISFYNVKDPFHPKLVDQQESPYLNLIRFIPGTSTVVNTLFLPQNQLVLGKIMIEKQRSRTRRYRYIVSSSVKPVPLQFGRLPWNVTLIPHTSRKYKIVITNSTEPLVDIATLAL